MVSTGVTLSYAGAFTHSGNYTSAESNKVYVPKPDIELKDKTPYWAVSMFPAGTEPNNPRIVYVNNYYDEWHYDEYGDDRGYKLYGLIPRWGAIKLLKEATYD